MARIPGIDAAFALLQARSSAEAGEAFGRVVDAVGQAAGAAQAVAVDAAESVVGAGRASAETVQQARETLAAVHRVALRADGIMDEVEEPIRALAPGLRRLAALLDDPTVADLPRTVRQLQDEVLPLLRTLTETKDRLTYIAGSTDRIMSFVDDTSRLVGGLPGAGLLGRRRVPGRVITVEQVDPPTS